MKNAQLLKTIGTSLMVCGIVVAHPFSPAAQEAAPAQQEKPAGKMSMQGMKGHEHRAGMMAEMHKMHAQMESMHREMTQELQKQLTALRAQAKAMEGISDEKQLLGELKKHQQMTDDLLATMIDQHEKMHTQMEAHHKQMQSQMGKTPPTEKEEPEKHEPHPQ